MLVARRVFAILCLMLGASVAQAQAQTEIPDGYTTVPVSFSGFITSSVTDELVLRDANGDLTLYTGPLPDYPFDSGDPITLGFDAVVPTGEAIRNGIVPPSADGIYRFQIGPRPSQLGDFPGTASYVNFTGSDGISDTGRYGTDGGLAIVYDANTDSYSIDPSSNPGPGGDTFGIGFFDFPFLTYDVATGSLRVAQLSELFPNNNNGAAWSGTGDTTGRIPTVVYNYDGNQLLGNTGPLSPRSDGNVRFSGNWNLPLFNGSGPPVPVPAPPMIVLFGLALAAIMRRRHGAMRPVV